MFTFSTPCLCEHNNHGLGHPSLGIWSESKNSYSHHISVVIYAFVITSWLLATAICGALVVNRVASSVAKITISSIMVIFRISRGLVLGPKGDWGRIPWASNSVHDSSNYICMISTKISIHWLKNGCHAFLFVRQILSKSSYPY